MSPSNPPILLSKRKIRRLFPLLRGYLKALSKTCLLLLPSAQSHKALSSLYQLVRHAFVAENRINLPKKKGCSSTELPEKNSLDFLSLIVPRAARLSWKSLVSLASDPWLCVSSFRMICLCPACLYKQVLCQCWLDHLLMPTTTGSTSFTHKEKCFWS